MLTLASKKLYHDLLNVVLHTGDSKSTAGVLFRVPMRSKLFSSILRCLPCFYSYSVSHAQFRMRDKSTVTWKGYESILLFSNAHLYIARISSYTFTKQHIVL